VRGAATGLVFDEVYELVAECGRAHSDYEQRKIRKPSEHRDYYRALAGDIRHVAEQINTDPDMGGSSDRRRRKSLFEDSVAWLFDWDQIYRELRPLRAPVRTTRQLALVRDAICGTPPRAITPSLMELLNSLALRAERLANYPPSSRPSSGDAAWRLYFARRLSGYTARTFGQPLHAGVGAIANALFPRLKPLTVDSVKKNALRDVSPSKFA
jgi:hypothetical protein